MSRLKISPNLFLEVNELNRLQEFIVDKGYKLVINSMIKSYGIVRNENNTNFKLSLKSGTNNVLVINPGIAINKNVEVALLEEALEIQISDSGVKKWVLLSRAVTNEEIGNISISANGTITGTNTQFLKVLRGQPNFPTKVKLNSTNNTEEYEVISVLSDTSAILAGTFFPESGIKYSTIGTFTPGFQVTEDNKYIYEYDYVSIRIVDSETQPILNENEYILGTLTFASGFLVIEDKRNDYLFNEEDFEYKKNDYSENENSVVSLLDVKRIEEKRIELVFESGYKINSFEQVSTAESNIVRILGATNNYLNYTGNLLTPANSLFKGWVLLNKKNMKSSLIDDNIGADLYVSKLEIGMITGSGDDLVIIPNFSEIEFQISFSGAETRLPMYFKVAANNIQNRFNVPIAYGNNTVTLKYRITEGINKSSKFQPFNIAQFNNSVGNLELLAESNFNIYIEQILPIQNYS